MTCACQATISGHVDYCALHAAAPELLAACKETGAWLIFPGLADATKKWADELDTLADGLEAAGEVIPKHDVHGWVSCLRAKAKQLRAVTAQAEGRS